MGSRMNAAKALAAELVAAGLPAFTSAAAAAANRPAVLVPPPRVEFGQLGGGQLVTWQLQLLAYDTTGSDQAWAELDTLLDQLADVADVETAEPGSYVLGERTVPSYRVTATETLE